MFVIVAAFEANPVPGREAFTLVTTDEDHDLMGISNTLPVDLDVPGEPYTPDQEGSEPRGWLVFDVSAQLDMQPSLRLEGETGAWKWGLDTDKATAPPPAWDWTASTTETVRPSEKFDITVSAENVGDGPGTFRGAVNFSHPFYHSKGFDIELVSGASGETPVSARSRNAAVGRDLEHEIRTPSGTAEVSVTVEAESTATGSTN